MMRLLVLLLTALAITAGLTLPAGAQTPEQLEIFRNLTPEQQRAVLEQMNNGRGATSSSRSVDFPATSAPKQAEDAGLVEVEPRFRGNDTLLLRVDIRPLAEGAPPRDPSTARALDELRARMLAGNPYRLDRAGVLQLPGTPPIPLAGLDVAQATARLNSDPALADLQLGVSLLPVEPTLKPFGYDLFTRVPTTFAPATDIPVPAEYVVGPGDTFEVLLVGERGGRYTLTVGRDGTVDFPQLGPIAVAGLRFASAKDLLEQRVAEQMIGMRASVSMGALRSIQVFVLGEAEQPGSYTVSGLSTITNALFASGGVKPIGSLRNIQLKRNGQVVRTLDLYDLLLNGDTSGDVRLLPGDVIFIPPVGTTVAVEGEIQRPAIYEVKPGAVASEILYLSGGLTPTADPRSATLERIDERRNRTVVDVDLTTPQGRGVRLQTGDSPPCRSKGTCTARVACSIAPACASPTSWAASTNCDRSQTPTTCSSAARAARCGGCPSFRPTSRPRSRTVARPPTCRSMPVIGSTCSTSPPAASESSRPSSRNSTGRAGATSRARSCRSAGA